MNNIGRFNAQGFRDNPPNPASVVPGLQADCESKPKPKPKSKSKYIVEELN